MSNFKNTHFKNQKIFYEKKKFYMDERHLLFMAPYVNFIGLCHCAVNL